MDDVPPDPPDKMMVDVSPEEQRSNGKVTPTSYRSALVKMVPSNNGQL